jgi:hypothetical protein
VCLLVLAATAAAQAFLPPAREGNIATTYQRTFARGHLDDNGVLFTGGEKSFAEDPDIVHAQSVLWDAEYGITNRVAVNLSLPAIAARYEGTDPHLLGVKGQPSSLDDGAFHGGFQDFHAGARVSLWSRPVAITPLVEIIVPSHHYESLGHSVIGLDLRALVLGVATGGFFDRLPGAYFQAQVSHAVVQEVLGVRPNRTRVDGQVGYFITPRLGVQFLESYQWTHDGLDFFAGPPFILIHSSGQFPLSFDYYLNHDRIERVSFLNLGGGVTYAVNDSIDLFAAGSKLVWGQNIHPPRGLSVGANWHFRLRGGPPSTPQRLPHP